MATVRSSPGVVALPVIAEVEVARTVLRPCLLVVEQAEASALACRSSRAQEEVHSQPRQWAARVALTSEHEPVL